MLSDWPLAVVKVELATEVPGAGGLARAALAKRSGAAARVKQRMKMASLPPPDSVTLPASFVPVKRGCESDGTRLEAPHIFQPHSQGTQ